MYICIYIYIKAILKDQPGIALELQTALALSISESDRVKVKEMGKENVTQFLDEAKTRFAEVDRGLSQKKVFGKMVLNLARQVCIYIYMYV
jgi:hypothetical protein